MNSKPDVFNKNKTVENTTDETKKEIPSNIIDKNLGSNFKSLDKDTPISELFTSNNAPDFTKVKQLNTIANEDTNEHNNEIKMLSATQKQLNARHEGESMGLKGKELRDFILNKTKDITHRPELSEFANKGGISYNEEDDDEEEIVIGTKTRKQQIEKDNDFDFEGEELEVFNSIKNVVEINDKIEEDRLKKIEQKMEKFFEKLSETQYDAPYELVPLPSRCKQYGMKDDKIKIAFMNGSDEDLLTNPNINKSGKLLEILFKRKILSDIEYEDLVQPDIDAIMLWLRTTAYGTDYTIEVTDPKDNSKFEVDLDLSKLPVKYLNLNINENGYFEFVTSRNTRIEFLFMTNKDIMELHDEIKSNYEEMGEFFTNGTNELYTKIIKGINGVYDKESVSKKVSYMSIKELREFKKFMVDNEFGVDLLLNITTLGGESVQIPFPINRSFFGLDE